MNRCRQLTSLRALHDVREKSALQELQQHQRTVATLEAKLAEIEKCIEGYRQSILNLDGARLMMTSLTATGLKEEAAHRRILERDLRKELHYLDTALKDLQQAGSALSEKRRSWLKQCNRSNALAVLARE